MTVDGTGQYYFDQETHSFKEDGNGPVYGSTIVFDAEGQPIVKIVDDIICSAYIKCVCDENYPPAAFIISEPLSKARKQINDSGFFTPLRKKYLLFGKCYCSCKTCGAGYSLSGWNQPFWRRITPYTCVNDRTMSVVWRIPSCIHTYRR